MFKLASPNPSHSTEQRLLVIDSDDTTCSILQAHLGSEGIVVDYCNDVDEIATRDLSSYKLLILNLDMCRDMGHDIIGHIRQQRATSMVGVIVSSIDMSATSIVNALNAGADDYLLQPYAQRELLARVRAVLRRRG
jgi:DNA-binding response OmpR family regulator